MDLSGIIFVVLAVAWAVYLIPKALKQNDEVARSRSIEGFSSAMRVLAHREPVGRDSRLVVPPRTVAARPERPAARTVQAPASASAPAPAPVPAPVESAVPRRRPRPRRTPAGTAARRRRRVLSFLLLCVVATASAAYLSYVPWWSVSVPGALTLVYLVLCRTQALRESRPAARSTRRAVPAAPRAEPEQQHVEEVRASVRPEPAVEPAAEPAEQPVAEAVEQAEPAEQTDEQRGSLWDPLPVTLPTYVTKAKASRTVRTIDLGEPGTWTSGRTVGDAEIAARATDPAPSEDGSTEGGQRAVGG